MPEKLKKIIQVISLFAILLAAGCGGSEVGGEPTQDPKAVYTQVVLTVKAGLALTAAAKPTNTLEPSATATVAKPTAPLIGGATSMGFTQAPQTPGIGTTLPGLTPGSEMVSGTPNSLATLLAFTPNSTGSGPLMVPTTSKTVQKQGDSCIYQSQSPLDGFTIPPNNRFHIVWSVLNNGTSIWTNKYRWIYKYGPLLGEMQYDIAATPADPNDANGKVDPGEKSEIFQTVVAPGDPGKYKLGFFVVNNNGAKICEVFLSFSVVAD